MDGDFWAILKTSLFKKKTAVGIFGQPLEKFGPLFIWASGHTVNFN